MGLPIHDKTFRAQLEQRSKPYYTRLAGGVSIGYRKGKTVSRWVVRRYQDGSYRTHTIPGAEPDDARPADGARILSFHQLAGRIMAEFDRIPARCSFCGKGAKSVRKLVAGPGVFICDGCIHLCNLYLEYDAGDGKLALDDAGQPLMEDDAPVCVPLTADELQHRAWIDTDVK